MESFVSPVRRKTREVRIGDVIVGGSHPIVVQSMTTTPTTDTNGTVDQIQKLMDVGCEIVRVTTPTMADVDNLPSIRAEMKRRKLSVPLVADVHFLPQLALKACEYVEKVRVNPGNFADRKRFAVMEYTDAEYAAELDRVREAFLPVVRRAKERGVALRIGTNHGSLSDRIMNRFGDNPAGMVESALEFVHIAQDEGFHDIVLSMKASNTRVMIQAYRLLVARMNELNMDYPLHLGVTEAGDGEDGRIKSAIGIGGLLADGLGDTIRVSLTEDPEREIPVAKLISKHYVVGNANGVDGSFKPVWNPYEYSRRSSLRVGNASVPAGGTEIVRVRTSIPEGQMGSFVLSANQWEPPVEIGSFDISTVSGKPELLSALPRGTSLVIRLNGETAGDLLAIHIPFDQISVPAAAQSFAEVKNEKPVWFRVADERGLDRAIVNLKKIGGETGIEIEGPRLIALGRFAAARLSGENIAPPIHLHFIAGANEPEHDVLIRASTEIGSLLCDGIGDSVEVTSGCSAEFNHRLAFNILQAARVRMSKTEYIACPSCGRTLFDLQETTARIRAQTSHLKGVKLAIMGCVVNGPGEMADADFGYVGSGPGIINLYVGKECVERHIPQAQADRRLIELIKKHGRWLEPA